MLFPSLTITLSVWLALSQIALGAPRRHHISPPPGALVVRKSPGNGEFANISSAVKSLPDDNSAHIIFIFPGTYTEQVRVTRLGPLIVRYLISSRNSHFDHFEDSSWATLRTLLPTH